MSEHPDENFHSNITLGLMQGFRVGFKQAHQLRCAGRNMPSTDRHPVIVDNHNNQEMKADCLIGPLADLHLHTNRIGVITKGHTPWKLITDLSHPQSLSTNDSINPTVRSLSYVTVDMVAKTMQALRSATLMANVYIEYAYRIVPVHPDDCHLFEIQ